MKKQHEILMLSAFTALTTLSQAHASPFSVKTCPPAVNNSGSITPTYGDSYGVYVNGLCSSVTNTNTINSNIGINLFGMDAALGVGPGGQLLNLDNSGVIRGKDDNYAISVNSTGRITNLNNTLNIIADKEDIYNNGSIAVINNGLNGIIQSKYIAIGNYAAGGFGVIDAINNSGRIQINSQSGPNAAGIYNENVISSFVNSGVIYGGAGAWSTLYNTGAGYIGTIDNSGSILGGSISSSAAPDPAIQFGSNAAASSTLTNTGRIIGRIYSSTMGAVTINQNLGSITGNINLAAATSIINLNDGTVTGSINFNGSNKNELNISGGQIIGDVTNTVANKLVVNANSGAYTTQGNIGSASAYIAELNLNSGANFAAGSGYNIYVNTAKINKNATLNLAGIPQFINAVMLSGGTLTNGSFAGPITTTGGTVNNIGGSTSLTSTAGLTTLTGTNNYTGPTTVNGGTVTVAGGSSLTSNASITSGGTFNNNGTMSGTVNNACGGSVNNTGSINNNVINAGSLINIGTIGGTLTNNTPCGSVTNSGTVSGVVTNNADIINSGTINNTVSNTSTAAFINSVGGTVTDAFTNSGIVSNSGSINSAVTNTGGGLFGNFGTLASTVSNNSNSEFINYGSGTIAGQVTNQAGATFDHFGAINAAVVNNGTFNLDNLPTITGAVSGTGTTTVNGQFLQQNAFAQAQLDVNQAGTFIATQTVNVPTVNVNNGGTFAVLDILSPGTPISVGGNMNLNSGGLLELTDSANRLNINGALTMAAGSGYFVPIGGVTDYGQTTTTGPLNIANGAVIIATVDPTQKFSPGTVLSGVLQGGSAPTQAGQIAVLNSSQRYQFGAQWAGNNVNLVLPNRVTTDYNAVFGPGAAQSSGIKFSQTQKVAGGGGSVTLATNTFTSPGNGGTGGYGGIYTGALAQQTLQSVAAVQGPTLGLMHQRYAMLNAVMEYDCNKFEIHNFCLSFQARATGFGSQSTGAGVFNIAYRPVDQVRVGAFLDYQVTAGNPVLNNIYSGGAAAVYNGNVLSGYDNPTFGGYVGFSQSGYSGRVLNKGVQAFLSGGYNPGKVTVTRAMMLDQFDPSFVDAQPGMGTASLNSYYYRGMVGYGFGVTDQVTFMPYGGMRVTDVTRGGYMESYNALVAQPLVYNSFGEHLFTGFGGMMLNGQMTQQLGVLVGLGAEADISRSASNFGGYAPIKIERMGDFAFGHGSSYNGIRPTGNVGAYYDFAKNQRLMINAYAGQQAWSSRTYTTGLLGYQVAF